MKLEKMEAEIKKNLREAAESITSLEYLEIFLAGYLKAMKLKANKEIREELEKLYGKNVQNYI